MLIFAIAAGLAVAPPSPAIDVYTMGRGDALFHRFGHAAICTTYDQRPKKSRCYNYGTTDFGSPPEELGWGFVKGTSQFWVSVWKPKRMLREYVEHDRSVWRQRIPISPTEAREVEAKLREDAARYHGKSSDAVYQYHHFDDNCTTRVRDIIDEATHGRLREGTDEPVGLSYRELGRRGLADKTAIIVTDHIFVGREADVVPTRWEAMFLPKYMRDSIEDRLGAEPELVYKRKGPTISEHGSGGKGWLGLIVLLAFLPMAAGYGLRRGWRAGLAITGGLISLVGLVLLFLALISEMPELRYNEALLLFWPTDVLLAILDARRRRAYARVRVVSLALVAVGLAAGALRQPLCLPLLVPLLPNLLVALRPEGRSGSRPHGMTSGAVATNPRFVLTAARPGPTIVSEDRPSSHE